MGEPTAFQRMNGCSACKHARDADPSGTPAAIHGKAYWCTPLAKPVDARDGAACPSWAPAT